MKIDGPTIALILSILGLMASLFLTKLGNDVRKNRIKNQCISRRQYICKAIKEHWQEKEAPQSVLVKSGKAPSPIYLGSRSPRWKESDLQNYLEDPMIWEKNHKVS